MPTCYPIPIVEYAKMIKCAYTRKGVLALCKWKLRDNYTYTEPEDNS